MHFENITIYVHYRRWSKFYKFDTEANKLARISKNLAAKQVRCDKPKTCLLSPLIVNDKQAYILYVIRNSGRG